MRAGSRNWPTLIVGVVLAALLIVSVWRVLPAPAPLPDFAAIDNVQARKQAFFEFLAPRVVAENRRVLEARARLLEIEAAHERGRPPSWLDHRWLRRLAAEYAVQWQPDALDSVLERLTRRVDVVPPALALVQAATESGWGRSRFAIEANNLFGHWCYERGCGLVPEARVDGARHEVAAFDSVRDAIARYVHNLNTHDAYRPFRRLRDAQRSRGERPSAAVLVDGLIRYSERRGAYVEDIRSTIRSNRRLIDRALEATGGPA